MGRPKLLLPWNDTTILGHLIATWRALGTGQIAVVVGAGDEGIAAELERLGFPASQRILNPDPDRGMFSSVQCAAAWPGWKPALTHFAIILGDQPHLRPATLSALADFAARNPARICQPSHRGRPRHPVVLPSDVFREITRAQAQNLKEFLLPMATGILLLEQDDPGLEVDIDRPADYELARRLPDR